MTFPDIIRKVCKWCKGAGRQKERQYRCEDCHGTGHVHVCGHCDAYLQDCKCTCTTCGEEHSECECETGGDE